MEAKDLTNSRTSSTNLDLSTPDTAPSVIRPAPELTKAHQESEQDKDTERVIEGEETTDDVIAQDLTAPGPPQPTLTYQPQIQPHLLSGQYVLARHTKSLDRMGTSRDSMAVYIVWQSLNTDPHPSHHQLQNLISTLRPRLYLYPDHGPIPVHP